MGDIDENEEYLRSKWSEQEMIQTRRSVSSSPSSESEINDAQEENKLQPEMASHIPNTANLPTSSNEIGIPNSVTLCSNEIILNGKIQEMMSFSAQQQSILHSASQMSQFNIPNENGPVSLFPPTSGSQITQIPFPSPGAAMFPPTFANAYSSTAISTNSQSTSKHGETLASNVMINNSMNYPNLCAAYTSSSRNITLTTSMIVPSPIQSDVSSLSSPNVNNLELVSSSQLTHITGNNNNNNISSNNKIDFNRKCKNNQFGYTIVNMPPMK